MVCRAAEAGEYGLQIYVSDASVNQDGSSFHQVCQYLIICDETAHGEGAVNTLPRIPPSFLGPQSHFQQFDVQCSSHVDPYIVTPSGELQVRMVAADVEQSINQSIKSFNFSLA